MSAVRDKVKYAVQRDWFERWAAWREHRRHIGIGRTKDSLLARIMQYGVRIGVVNYHEELEIDEIPELVETFMYNLRMVDPLIHLCLEARHRKVIGTLNVGMKEENGHKRHYRDVELAHMCLGAKDQVTLMQFRRYCDTGYERLKNFSNVT